MPLPKFSSKWKKSPAKDAATGEPAPEAKTVATAAAPEEKAAATQPTGVSDVAAEVSGAAPPAAETAGDSQPRAARLVEGERMKSSGPAPLHVARRTLSRAVTATKPAHKPAAAAAALALAAGLGFAGGSLSQKAGADQGATGAAGAARIAVDSQRLDGAVTQVSEDLAALRTRVAALSAERPKSSAELSPKQVQLLDRLDRAGQEQAGRITRLGDALERAQRESARIAGVVERLDRIEKAVATGPAPAISTAVLSPPLTPPALVQALPAQPAPAPTPPPKPSALAPAVPDVTQTGSIETRAARPDVAKPEQDPRRIQLDGFVIRDVEDGYALIESRSGRFFEVATGQVLAGIGRVEAVERRGRQWVVVTQKGFIGERWN